MAAKKDVSCIKFEYKGVKYRLEYDRDSAMQAEKAYDVSLMDVKDAKMSALSGMFKGAFIKNHPETSPELMDEIFAAFTNKGELYRTLALMYTDCLAWLIEEPEEGNAISWTAM